MAGVAMTCHQKIIRDRRAAEDSDADMFGRWWEDIDTSPSRAIIREVDHVTARSIIKKYEWLGTYCNAPLAAFGIFWDGNCGGVVVYGSPSPPNVAASVCGQKNSPMVCQLGRGACVHWAHKHAASMLISASLREMGRRGYGIAIAYSDPDADEIGTVYQATNWTYCGLTAKRPDYFDSNGVRKVGHFQVDGLSRGPRTRKHRYVHFLGSRQVKRRMKAALLWKVEQYPKRADCLSDAPSPDGVSREHTPESAP